MDPYIAPRKMSPLEKKLRYWLSRKYSPCIAVFATNTVTDLLKEYAFLTPSELLRPFVEVDSLDQK